MQQDRASWARKVAHVTAASTSENPPAEWVRPVLQGLTDYPTVVNHILTTPSPGTEDFQRLFTLTEEDGGDVDQQVHAAIHLLLHLAASLLRTRTCVHA